MKHAASATKCLGSRFPLRLWKVAFPPSHGRMTSAAMTCMRCNGTVGAPSIMLRCSAGISPSSLHSNQRDAADSTQVSERVVHQQLQVSRHMEHLRAAVGGVLVDRRVLYRDQELLELLTAPRQALRDVLLSALTSPLSDKGDINVLSPQFITSLRAAWANALTRDAFYAATLASGLVTSLADVHAVLGVMREEGTPTSATIIESIIASLPVLCATQSGTGSTADSSSTPTSSSGSQQAPSKTILGLARVIDRGAMGDHAGYYMGVCLKQASSGTTTSAPAEVMDRLWGTFFTVTVLSQAAPKLLDLWWQKLLESHQSPEHTALPIEAVQAVLSSSASHRDIERSLRYFHEANQRGVVVHSSTTSASEEDGAAVKATLSRPGGLTTRSDNRAVQHAQLRLLGKLMETGKSVKYDGGLRELVVKDVRRLIDTEVLEKEASWFVVNDILSGLSLASAMQLVKQCSRAREQGDAGVPFAVWASLLRRCAHAHYQDEANALFLFIRKRFTLTATEKRELVEIMLRMHAAMGDFASAMDLFLVHVLQTPEKEPFVPADVTLYNLLIQAADSRNAAMMVFLEACAAGVGMDPTTFENLLASSPYSSVARLSKRLPYDYMSSQLDSQLRIPVTADAHARREEALQARGKPLFSSTGESG